MGRDRNARIVTKIMYSMDRTRIQTGIRGARRMPRETLRILLTAFEIDFLAFENVATNGPWSSYFFAFFRLFSSSTDRPICSLTRACSCSSLVVPECTPLIPLSTTTEARRRCVDTPEEARSAFPSNPTASIATPISPTGSATSTYSNKNNK